MMPVRPPIVNRQTNPMAQYVGALCLIGLPNMVASQLNTLIPVGTAIIMVVAVKYARVSTSIPTVNIWWAHTIKPSRPILTIAYTIPRTPKISIFWAR